MLGRIFIAAMLMLSLLFAGQAQLAPKVPAGVLSERCAMAQCGHGCCTSLTCCATVANQAPQEKSMSAQVGSGLDGALFRLYGAAILRWSPPAQTPTWAAVAAALPPARPRLAMSCIQLI